MPGVCAPCPENAKTTLGGPSTDDPSASVVNTDLAVHGLDNLHVASCAVFPSGSSSNPTFTMMALTLRLADRLIEILAETPANPATADILQNQP